MNNNMCIYIDTDIKLFLVIWKAWLVKEKVWTARKFIKKKLPKGKAAILVNSWSDWFSDCKYFRNCPISCDNNFLLIISIMLQPVVFQRLWISWTFLSFFFLFWAIKFKGYSTVTDLILNSSCQSSWVCFGELSSCFQTMNGCTLHHPVTSTFICMAGNENLKVASALKLLSWAFQKARLHIKFSSFCRFILPIYFYIFLYADKQQQPFLVDHFFFFKK